jgi:hypothetical protein
VKLHVVSITDMKTIPPCVGMPRLGVSGCQHGSNYGHRDEPTTSMKVVVRVTRVIGEVPISTGFSREMSEDRDRQFCFISLVDHGGLPPVPTTR